MQQARIKMIKDNMDKYKNRLAPLKVTSESMMIFECQLDIQYLLDALQQAQTELQQYRENPLLLMQPCWKYVKKNNISRQLTHVLEEVKEADNAKNINDIYLECFDIVQAGITLMYILAVKYGVNLHELIQRGIEKNTSRVGGSYYG